MQAERDHLWNFVFPRLEEALQKRCHHLEWIDLRQGVEPGQATSGEERELVVLKVCLDLVKRSRPFIIGLLGDRYGWIPPLERAEAAVREVGFETDTSGKSVTALEIEFGVFEASCERHRCLFYLREPLPYDAMPAELRASYSEQFAADGQSTARRVALAELKRRLREHPEINSRVRTYRAGWNPETNCVTGLEAWGNQVFEDLWRALEEETEQFAAEPSPGWEELEKSELLEFVEPFSSAKRLRLSEERGIGSWRLPFLYLAQKRVGLR
jgi:hypothetical protein